MYQYLAHRRVRLFYFVCHHLLDFFDLPGAVLHIVRRVRILSTFFYILLSHSNIVHGLPTLVSLVVQVVYFCMLFVSFSATRSCPTHNGKDPYQHILAGR